MGEMTMNGEAVLERLSELPGGPELLATAEERQGGMELVGGAVRDILLGSTPRELDVVVDGEVELIASSLSCRLGGDVTFHERFGTAVVRSPRGNIDLATVRSESYASPGALPDVSVGTPEEDLARRDFTVNAIAVGLAGERRGVLSSVEGALGDLANRRLRVLHDQSFVDDPTRILRLARYVSRLGFEVEPHTAALAASALEGGALSTVSGQRLGAELRLALAEPDPVASLGEIQRMGVFAVWESDVSFNERLVRTALEILPEDGSKEVLLAASLLLDLADGLEREDTEPAMRGLLYDLELPSGSSERAFSAAISARLVGERIDCTESTAELLELVEYTPIESIALSGALRDMEDGPTSFGRKMVEDWLGRMRHITLQITGDDLIAAGVPEGPEVGRRLEVAYEMRLDGLIEEDRDEELRAALEAEV